MILESVLVEGHCVYLCPFRHRDFFKTVCWPHLVLRLAPLVCLVSYVEGSVREVYHYDEGYLYGVYLRYQGEVYWVHHTFLTPAGYLSW